MIMKDSTVRAYAQAYAVVDKAIQRKKKDRYACNKYMDKAMPHPISGFTEILRVAHALHALTPRDDEVISAALSQVDEVAEEGIHPIPAEQQGIWILAVIHWQDNYTPAEAAKALGVTKQRISVLVNNGKLDSIKANGRVYISGASVDRRKHHGMDEGD